MSPTQPPNGGARGCIESGTGPERAKGPPSANEATSQASKLSGFLLAFCFLSYILHLFNSNAVRHIISETVRLLQKFPL